MSAVVSNKYAAEICDALGLKNVCKLDLHFSVNEVATADVTFFPDENGVKQVAPILRHYELTERKE